MTIKEVQQTAKGFAIFRAFGALIVLAYMYLQYATFDAVYPSTNSGPLKFVIKMLPIIPLSYILAYYSAYHYLKRKYDL
jgi:hypothetical protein